MDPGEIQQKGVVQRGLAVALVPPGGTAVPGVHVRLQKKAMLIGLGGAELGNPLCRLPVLHLAIMQASRNQDVGIRLGLDVVIR